MVAASRRSRRPTPRRTRSSTRRRTARSAASPGPGAAGRPKLVVAPGPRAAAPGAYAGLFGPLGFGVGQTQLVAGPLYHAMPFVTSHWGLFEDHTLVLMARFDAARAVDLIERHRVEWAYLAPTMMHRIVALPGLAARDFSSLRSIASTAAPCAPWLKRAWIALLGPERVAEAYLQSEGVGGAVIRGDEWLAHPGSVGKPYLTELRILDDAGNALPPGAVGEIYMRFDPQLLPSPHYHYIGAPAARATPDGLESVGDLGWLDEEGYLYIAERRVDLVITGGANVYPAEVEAALSEHPGI